MDPDPLALDSLLAARRSLRAGLDKSKSLSAALARAGPRLDEIRARLPSLESAVRPARAPRAALSSAASHIDRAVGPAAAVLKVFDAVHGLEPPLLLPSPLPSPLSSYLSLLSRLQEALRFLSDNSPLALQWLDDILDYLSDHSLADPPFLSGLQSLLASLRDSKAPLDAGLLDAVLAKLLSEFRRLLSDHSNPLPMNPNPNPSAAASIAPSPLPVPVIHSLTSILNRMISHGRLDDCVSAFIDVRGSTARAALDALGLDYLRIGPADFDDVQSIEADIGKWGRHLEFAVKHLLDAEYRLCHEVMENAGVPELPSKCFLEIADRAGFRSFLNFGMTVTESKKDPIKLLKLLDIFASLNKLRLDFNRLFGGKACVEIQNLTRDLIKRVIDGACDIFWELLVQVELQRSSPPPPDGRVPRLVTFITDYCDRLLGEDYRPVLTQVLVIHRSWKQEKFQDRLLLDAILNIIKALEANFDAWSKGYEDATLSYLFMMNTHWHFYKQLKGTKLGELLGDVWLREHEQYKEYYAAVFLRETWGKLPGLLSRDGLILFSGGRATARDLVKKRLKAFNETLDAMYQKQSNWVVTDKELREKTCNLVVQAIVPAYRSYMQNYGPLVEQDASASKYAKYTAQSLEKMLGSLFQHKPVKSVSFRVSHSNGKVESVVSNQYRSAPTVV
ncbi:Exocyst complex component Exo70 protein [Dioscorea alata]|uniref:Exocyst complex component Exo70 protein n=1 Tax=Dioscorea alata TaxID=55571 RepID=A0ACB7VKE9_DIOAL|nr:Exocyst complex component Exo70 protein [Dioscorea alata]